MIVEQISVFIENKQGNLSAIADLLATNNIDISALSLAENSEYGMLRMIVSDPHLAQQTLSSSGIFCKVTKVLAVAIDDKPGGFAKSVKVLSDNNIGINYMYALVSHEKGKALMILGVDNLEKAQALIENSENNDIKPNDIYRI